MALRRLIPVLSLLCCTGLAAQAGDEPAAADHDVATALDRLARGAVEEQVAAAKVLGDAWPAGARGVPLLVAALGDGDASVAAAASAALGKLGDRGAERLLGFLADAKDPDREETLKALKAIRSLGAAIRPRDVAQAFPTEAGSACGPTTAVAPCVILALVPMWDAHPGLYDIYLLLVDRTEGRGGESVSPATPRTVEIASAALAVRAQAVFPPRPERTLPGAARPLLESPDARVRDAASLLAWRLRGGTPPASPALEQARRKPEDASAPRPAGRQDPAPPEEAEASVDALLSVLADSSQGSLKADRALRKLASRVEGMDSETRARVLKAITKARWRADRPFLHSQAMAAVYRAAPDAHEAVPELDRALVETLQAWNDLELRREAGRPVDLVRDFNRLGNDVREAFAQRYLLVEILGRIGPPAHAALPTLRPLLASDDLLLAYLARRAVTQIDPAGEEGD